MKDSPSPNGSITWKIVASALGSIALVVVSLMMNHIWARTEENDKRNNVQELAIQALGLKQNQILDTVKRIEDEVKRAGS